MVAYFEIRMAGERRVMKVDGIKSREHADKLLDRIKVAHADRAKLISVERYALHYTASEIERERNILGGHIAYEKEMAREERRGYPKGFK